MKDAMARDKAEVLGCGQITKSLKNFILKAMVGVRLGGSVD